MPKSIVYDQVCTFVSNFWRSLHSALGTRLDLSTAFHPQTDGQSECTIQTLEDLLRSCVLSWKGSWDHLPLVEFVYNNSYQASIKMAPYEALFGRRCISPLCWDVVCEKSLVGPDWVQQTHDKVRENPSELVDRSESSEELCRCQTEGSRVLSW